jgi:hypothetical protein
MIFGQFNMLHFGVIVRIFLNYKLQATNYKQTTNHKLQITKKKHAAVFLSPKGLFVIWDIVIWNLFVICDLYFVILSDPLQIPTHLLLPTLEVNFTKRDTNLGVS